MGNRRECINNYDCQPLSSNKVCSNYKCVCPSGTNMYANKCIRCDSGWTFNPRNGKCYYISGENELKTLSDAALFCASNGANIIQIDDSLGLGYPFDLFSLIGSIEWNTDFFWVNLRLNLF